MVASFLLVHSPALGPSSWAKAGEELRRRGYEVRVPDLTGVAEASPPSWEVFVGSAVEADGAGAGEVVVVGHSGAGVFLPAIGERLRTREVTLLFVDAVVPPTSGAHETPARLGDMLDSQTVEGRLRRWLEWWPEDTVAELLPDAQDRADLLADMPSLPRAFYDEAVPVPDGWADGRCAYLKLSAAYDAELAEAGRRGWPRRELDADHVAIRTRPAEVVDAIESLLPG